MRYEIIKDSLGYCQVIRHSNNPKKDIYELDLSKYDFSNGRLFAYKLSGQELIFDQTRYDEITKAKEDFADNKEINELQKKLNETDYIVARAFEEVMALNNPLTWIKDVIAIMVKYSKKYKETIDNRSIWRARIEELRNK